MAVCNKDVTMCTICNRVRDHLPRRPTGRGAAHTARHLVAIARVDVSLTPNARCSPPQPYYEPDVERRARQLPCKHHFCTRCLKLEVQDVLDARQRTGASSEPPTLACSTCAVRAWYRDALECTATKANLDWLLDRPRSTARRCHLTQPVTRPIRTPLQATSPLPDVLALPHLRSATADIDEALLTKTAAKAKTASSAAAAAPALPSATSSGGCSTAAVVGAGVCVLLATAVAVAARSGWAPEVLRNLLGTA